MAQVIVRSGPTDFVQEIEGAGHRWVSDEPPHLGGQDRGPTPYQLLLSSLGACTAITLQMYAKRKQWPVESVQVELTHERLHARDCEDCESTEGYISEIKIKLSLVGDLTDEQRERLHEIAGKCPVKKTLMGDVRVRSQLA